MEELRAPSKKQEEVEDEYSDDAIDYINDLLMKTNDNYEFNTNIIKNQNEDKGDQIVEKKAIEL